MLANRVIPFLLVKDGGLVKTQRFKDPTYVGDPINAIRIFNEKEVDELALLDICASASGCGPNFDLVRDVASECFMPLAYGGGIRDLEDAKRLLSLGVEKVILRTAAVADLSHVSDIAGFSGSQSVAVSIDVKRDWHGDFRLHAPRTRMNGDAGWLTLLRDAAAAGAGEVVLNSVHRDGTMAGMDTVLIGEAAQGHTTPLLAVGGVGSLADIRAGLDAGANAIGAGAFFVFHGPRRAVLITYPSPDELEILLEGRADGR